MASFELTPLILLLSFFLVGVAVWFGSYIVFFRRRKPDKRLKLHEEEPDKPEE